MRNRSRSLAPVRAVFSLPALAFALIGCWELPPTGESGAEQPRIEWRIADGQVVVHDAPKRLVVPPPGHGDWPKFFSVSVAGNDGTAMLGEYSVDLNAGGGKTIRFVPRFPLAPGVTYRAALPELKLESKFTVPMPPRPAPAVVTNVYPSADEVPENLLRLYVHFSEPMRRGEAYDYIRLIDRNGKEVPTPFLTLGEELWDEPGKRLTLLFDPGRIKHGLRPREQLGPILDAGNSYTLVIDPKWRDANGQNLQREYRRSFRVGKPADFGIDLSNWTIEPPAVGGRSALILRFPAPLDHALLHRMITIARTDGSQITGKVSTADQEKTWRFEPTEAWRAGEYDIVVNRSLEDVAGNRVGQPFEVDSVSSPLAKEEPPVRRHFAIR